MLSAIPKYTTIRVGHLTDNIPVAKGVYKAYDFGDKCFTLVMNNCEFCANIEDFIFVPETNCTEAFNILMSVLWDNLTQVDGTVLMRLNSNVEEEIDRRASDTHRVLSELFENMKSTAEAQGFLMSGTFGIQPKL